MSCIWKTFIVNPFDSTNADNVTAIGLVHKKSIGMRGNNLLSDWMSRRECHGVIFASVNHCHAPSLVKFLLKRSDILNMVLGESDVNTTNRKELASEYVHSWEATTLALFRGYFLKTITLFFKKFKPSCILAEFILVSDSELEMTPKINTLKYSHQDATHLEDIGTLRNKDRSDLPWFCQCSNSSFLKFHFLH